MSPGNLPVTPFCFQDFGSFSLSLFRIPYQVDSLSFLLLLLFFLVWWAFILFFCLLGISLPFHLVYIAVFGVAFLYSGSWWFLFIVEVPRYGWGCKGFLVREACVSVLVGGAGFLLSRVQGSVQ